MSGNGSPLGKPSPSTEQRVQVHLRKSRGKSPRLLARRYRRSLVGYLHALEADPDAPDLAMGALDARTITALKIVAACAAERARIARTAVDGGHDPEVGALVNGAVADALEALTRVADGDEPGGLRKRYGTDERAPPYLIVVNALGEISERGKMD